MGLLVLNVAALGVGATLLWSLRTWRYWTELVRLTGVAYLLGVAALVVVLTGALVVHVPFGLPLLLSSALGLALLALVAGWASGAPRPRTAPPGWRLRRPRPLALPFVLGIGLYFAVLFRTLRMTPLFETDAWWVWTIRAKALYFFGDLGGANLVGGGETGYPSYPPGLSLVHAAAFEAIGRVDTVTLHVQHWFLGVGFAVAMLGLLAGRVRSTITLPLLLFILAMPGLADRIGWAMADCLLGYLVAVGGLLLYLWLEDGSSWRPVAGAVLLASAMLVKREGVVVVACVFVAILVASYAERRSTWPRLGLVGAAAFVLAMPWRGHLWVSGVRDEPTEGYLAFLEHRDRAGPSLRLVVETFLDPMWLGFGVIALVAIALSLTAGSRRMPLYALTLLSASIAASTFVIWSETAFSITQRPHLNPVFRMTLVTILVMAPLIPLLLESAWRRGAHSKHRVADSAVPRGSV